MDYRINEISYNVISGIVTTENDEKQLTKIQKKLLNFFIKHPNKVLSKQTLMEEVWGRIITENSVEKTISKLRSCIEENPLEPKIIVTHFGHGISFEGSLTPLLDLGESTDMSKQLSETSNKFKVFAFIGLSAVVVWALVSHLNQPAEKHQELQQSIKKNQHLLILPMTFDDITTSQVQEAGVYDLLKSTFNALDSEGSVIFEDGNLSNQQAMEKHWRIDNDLVVLQTSIEKNNEIYTAVLEMTNGLETINKTTLRSDSLGDLLNDQISFISNYHEGIQGMDEINNKDQTIDAKYIQALGHIKNDNNSDAIEILEKIIQKQEKHHRARFTLAEILLDEKQYDESLAQLNTLKFTEFYQQSGAEIELGMAKAKFQKKSYDELINDLQNYQVTHADISPLKKSKIKLQLADAYFELGNLKQATVFYQQALNNIEEKVSPLIYARSYLGQGRVLFNLSNNEAVYSHFSDALKFAKLANHRVTQIHALNNMSRVMFFRNEWQQGIALKKQAIELIQLSNDKIEVANSLSSLISYLMERGLFSEIQKANSQLGEIANELQSDTYQLHYLHYDIVVALNVFEFDYAKQQIIDQFELAKSSKNYGMMFNNSFLQFEYYLATENTTDFMKVWDERIAMMKELGFERLQIYMDLYLARYLHSENDNQAAIKMIAQVSKQAKVSQDFKFYVEAQNYLAEIHMQDNPQLALDILDDLEQFKPNPNPYLELKAIALNLLGRKVEALSLLNEAKLVFHEAWKAENQALLEHLQKSQTGQVL